MLYLSFGLFNSFSDEIKSQEQFRNKWREVHKDKYFPKEPPNYLYLYYKKRQKQIEQDKIMFCVLTIAFGIALVGIAYFWSIL